MAGDIIIGEGQQVLLLAHGAGAPMDSPFMDQLAHALSKKGIRVVRFEFEYMDRRRVDGKKRPPPRADKLLAEFEAKVGRYTEASSSLFVGGKSMGGRIASMLASDGDERVNGCVCFGYPFHPPGKPDRWRTDHFSSPASPILIQQGTRDPFGRREEVLSHFAGGQPVDIDWLDDGEHDLKPRKASGMSQSDLIERAAGNAAKWMTRRT